MDQRCGPAETPDFPSRRPFGGLLPTPGTPARCYARSSLWVPPQSLCEFLGILTTVKHGTDTSIDHAGDVEDPDVKAFLDGDLAQAK